MPEQPNMRIKFKPDFNSPTLEIGHADYRRVFSASDQPFSASQQEFDRHLARLSVFEIASEPISAAKPAPKSNQSQ